MSLMVWSSNTFRYSQGTPAEAKRSPNVCLKSWNRHGTPAFFLADLNPLLLARKYLPPFGEGNTQSSSLPIWPSITDLAMWLQAR